MLNGVKFHREKSEARQGDGKQWREGRRGRILSSQSRMIPLKR